MESQRVEPANQQQYENVLARTFQRLDALDCRDLLPDARQYFDRARELKRARLELPDRFDTDRQAILDALVAGETSPKDAATLLADVSRAAEERSSVPRLLSEAAQRAIVRSWQCVSSHGDALVADLQPLVEEIVRDSVSEAEKVPASVTTDEHAVQAGADVAAAWSRLGELHARWTTVHDLVGELRTNSALPVPDTGWPVYLDEVEFRYRRPERVRFPALRNVPFVLTVPTAAGLGAVPGIYTSDDVRNQRESKDDIAA